MGRRDGAAGWGGDGRQDAIPSRSCARYCSPSGALGCCSRMAAKTSRGSLPAREPGLVIGGHSLSHWRAHAAPLAVRGSTSGHPCLALRVFSPRSFALPRGSPQGAVWRRLDEVWREEAAGWVWNALRAGRAGSSSGRCGAVRGRVHFRVRHVRDDSRRLRVPARGRPGPLRRGRSSAPVLPSCVPGTPMTAADREGAADLATGLAQQAHVLRLSLPGGQGERSLHSPQGRRRRRVAVCND